MQKQPGQALHAAISKCPPVIRPESHKTPVEAKVSGQRLPIAAIRPKTRQARAKTASIRSTCATVPPLTSVIGLAPQILAWGQLRSTAGLPV